MMKTQRGIFSIVILIAAMLLAVLMARCATVGNIKFELIDTRAVVSCVDKSDPSVKMVERPTGGNYAVVSCERNGQ